MAVKRTPVELDYSNQSRRPLAVLLTWLAAKEKHIEKYRSLWLNKGFDVLTVKMSPQQLLLPTLGSIPLMQDVVKFMYAVSPNYPDMVLHCFSVGAYQFGEIMAQVNDPEFMAQIAQVTQSNDPKSTIENSIKGIIFDSAVNFDGIPEGVSKAMSLNPLVYTPLEMYIRGHLKIAYPIATKYYIRASDYAHGNYLKKAPGLFFSSSKDTIGAPWMAAKIAEMWRANGVEVKERIFPDSPHVQHIQKYETEYRKEVDEFLQKVPFTTLQ